MCICGPLISDEKFFSSVIIKHSDFSCAVQNGKYGEAKRIFASYVRENINKKTLERYITKTSPEFTYPYDDALRFANEALDLNMVSVGIYHKFDGTVDWYSNHTDNQYEEWTWQLSRHYQISHTAYIYASTKDEKYAKIAVELLYSWIKQAVVPPVGTDGHATLCWRTIEAGLRMLDTWPRIIFHLLDSPNTTDEFLVDFFKSVYEHAVRLSNDNTAANWLLMEMNGLYNLSVFFPFFKECEYWREQAKRIMFEQIKKQFFEDGIHYEVSFSYSACSILMFANVLTLSDIVNDKLPDEYSRRLLNAILANVKMRMPDDGAPPINDCVLREVQKFAKSYLSLFQSDPVLNWAANGYDPLAPMLDDTIYMQNAGLVSFKSGWSTNDIAGFFDGGKFGFSHSNGVIPGHQHEDKLNFLMYTAGKLVVTEGGTYAYDSSDMRKYITSSASHNTALVNNCGQNKRASDYWEDSLLSDIENMDFEQFGDYEIAKATYNEGYGKDAAIKCAHTRTVIFVKKPDDGMPYFIIKDKLQANEASNFDILWHYDTEKLVLSENGAYCNEITTLFLGDGEISVYKGSTEPFNGWYCNSMVQGIYRPIPTIYYTMNGKDKELITIFAPNTNGECKINRASIVGDKVVIEYKNGKIFSIQ